MSQNKQNIVDLAREDDDDSYSDDDFIEPVAPDDLKQLQIIQENTNEQDYSFVGEEGNANIEFMLKTATAKDMDLIRESLSNFHEVSKNFTNFAVPIKHDDDEGIEEDLEEEIPEANDSSSSEEHKYEAVKKQQTRKGRPVSAVYDLSHMRTGS